MHHHLLRTLPSALKMVQHLFCSELLVNHVVKAVSFFLSFALNFLSNSLAKDSLAMSSSLLSPEFKKIKHKQLREEHFVTSTGFRKLTLPVILTLGC